jgi:hypothetical protein
MTILAKLAFVYGTIIAVTSIAYGEQSKVDESYSETLYRENSKTIFLYTCEKTADCLGAKAGWSFFEEARGNGKYSCNLYGYRRSITIQKYEELLNLLVLCRTSHIKLMRASP